jgi:hypothetical protein
MSDTPGRQGPRILSIPEALAGGYPILDPLGDRLHSPGEEQYEAWREAYRTFTCRRCGEQTRNPALCRDCVNDVEAGDVPY